MRDRIDEADVVDREQHCCEETCQTHCPYLTPPPAPLHHQKEHEQPGGRKNSPQEQQRPRIDFDPPDQDTFEAEDQDADHCDHQPERGAGQASELLWIHFVPGHAASVINAARIV